VLIPTLFGQCYIGGWTAAHHWELTEQLFNETVVFTTRRISAQRAMAQGVVFLLHHAAKKRLFGLKSVWRGTTRVNISDPARTLIDMLAMPLLPEPARSPLLPRPDWLSRAGIAHVGRGRMAEDQTRSHGRRKTRAAPPCAARFSIRIPTAPNRGSG
jgi:hypothetical protein